MKIMEKWRRNIPDTVTGHSVTVTFTYSSFNKDEIDKLEKTLPKGIMISDTGKPDAGSAKVTPRPDTDMTWLPVYGHDTDETVTVIGYECDNCGYVAHYHWLRCPCCDARWTGRSSKAGNVTEI